MNRILAGGVIVFSLLGSGSPVSAQTHLMFSSDESSHSLVGKSSGKSARRHRHRLYPVLTPEEKRQNRRYNRFTFIYCYGDTVTIHDKDGITTAKVPKNFFKNHPPTPDCTNLGQVFDPDVKTDEMGPP